MPPGAAPLDEWAPRALVTGPARALTRPDPPWPAPCPHTTPPSCCTSCSWRSSASPKVGNIHCILHWRLQFWCSQGLYFKVVIWECRNMADGVNTKPLSANYCSVVLAALMSGDTSCHHTSSVIQWKVWSMSLHTDRKGITLWIPQSLHHVAVNLMQLSEMAICYLNYTSEII